MRDNDPGTRRRGSSTGDASRDRARSRALSRNKVAPLNTYEAIIARDESGAWIARIPEVPGCHTHGRTLEQARTRLREALGLWVDRADKVVIDERIRLEPELREAVERSRRTRNRAERERVHAQRETQAAADALVENGVSLRDAGELLGLSHQRVQQLVRR
jgi:predicted RNase H-like HicB family nuclease